MKKSIVSNSIFNILYKVINAVYPLIAVAYVSHILQSEKMGMVSYAQNIVSYFVIFAALGLPTYGTREIAKSAYDLNKRSQIFWELIFVNGISTIISLLLYILLIFNVNKFNQNLPLYFVAGLQIALNFLNVDWFYQGLEEYKYISIRNVLVKVIALLLLPVMVRSSYDYINYALIYCLAIAGNNAFNVVKLRKYIVRKNHKIQIKNHVQPIFVLLVASLSVEIYAMIDTTMLGMFSSDSVVGCYSNAMKLIRCVNTTAAAIGGVLLPRLSVVYDRGDVKEFNKLVNAGLRIMLMIAIPASVGLVVISKECVYVLFGESFAQAIPILRILAFMIPIVVCNTLLGAQVLVTTNMEKKYVLAVSISAVANVILNALLIPRFGAPSAAIASLMSELIVLGLYLYFSRNILRINLSFKFLISIILPLILYLSITFLILKRVLFNNIHILVINIVVCCIIYFGLGLLMRNEAMIFSINKLLKLMKKKQ